MSNVMKLAEAYAEACAEMRWHLGESAGTNENDPLWVAMKTARATLEAAVKTVDVTSIMLAVVQGDGDGIEVYAKNVDEVVNKLSEQGLRIEDLEGDNYTLNHKAQPVQVNAELVAAIADLEKESVTLGWCRAKGHELGLVESTLARAKARVQAALSQARPAPLAQSQGERGELIAALREIPSMSKYASRAHMLDDRQKLCERAAALLEAKPVPLTLNRPEIASYVSRYGGMCRDCADENGVCPNSGLTCASNKGIEHVLKALDYGLKHGYITAHGITAQGEQR